MFIFGGVGGKFVCHCSIYMFEVEKACGRDE